MKKLFISLFFIFLTFILIAQPSGYNFGKLLSIPNSSVSGSADLINFPLLISIADNDLRTVSNAGNVQNQNGYDIIFTTPDGSVLIDHQIEKYDPVTGEYVVWLRIPQLSASTTTNIHMYYGNNSVTMDPSKTATWTSSYGSVWHMNQSPAASAPQLIDYSANSNHGTANGSMLATDLVAGKIGNCISFDGSNDFFDCGSSASAHPTGDLTVSAWINSNTSSGHIINAGGGWGDPGYSLFYLGNGVRIELQKSGEKDIIDNGVGTDGNWHFVALTYNQSSGLTRCFIDGSFRSNTATFTGPIGTPVENLNIGRKEKNAYYFNGLIDEGRVILEDKSEDWLITEYNNQNDPSTFYSFGPEEIASDLFASPLPIELISFEASLSDDNKVNLEWQTASEINNNYFTIERSENGINWELLNEIKGIGYSSAITEYKDVDVAPYNGVSYYRLKQTDFDGTEVKLGVISIEVKSKEEELIKVYPNPAKNSVTIELNEGNKLLSIYDLSGREVSKLMNITSKSNSRQTLSIENLPKGIYIIITQNGQTKLIKE